jgi:deoxyribonuclease IV
MLGCHLSIAGGVHNALLEAMELHADCVQLFTQNQRQWLGRAIRADELAAWQTTRQQANLGGMVSHGSYLLNLASPDEALRRRSIEALGQEVVRCEVLEIPAAVIHPGSHRGAGVEAGLALVAQSLDLLARQRLAYTVTVCLELTAGQGDSVGWRLEQLRWVLDHVEQPRAFGVCLDTAHLLAAGYDLTSAAGAQAVLEEVDQVIGLDRVLAVHLNDSKTALGSRVDRHEHIGRGRVNLEALAAFINHPRLQNVPQVLETPKGIAPDGSTWDQINLLALRKLVSS